VGVLMKFFITLITLFSFAFSNQYTFLVNKYDKEIELEAKIVSNIAKSSIKNKIKLFIPKISDLEKKVYSKYFTLSETCEDSNFIFINKTIGEKQLCNTTNKLFLTNNYKKLIADKKYFGAFFWSKSRPNIVFISKRLKKMNIKLPKNYNQFIEYFNEK
jgi:DNA-binding Lrp family transcriptional regulator